MFVQYLVEFVSRIILIHISNRQGNNVVLYVTLGKVLQMRGTAKVVKVNTNTKIKNENRFVPNMTTTTP